DDDRSASVAGIRPDVDGRRVRICVAGVEVCIELRIEATVEIGVEGPIEIGVDVGFGVGAVRDARIVAVPGLRVLGSVAGPELETEPTAREKNHAQHRVDVAELAHQSFAMIAGFTRGESVSEAPMSHSTAGAPPNHPDRSIRTEILIDRSG